MVSGVKPGDAKALSRCRSDASFAGMFIGVSRILQVCQCMGAGRHRAFAHGQREGSNGGC